MTTVYSPDLQTAEATRHPHLEASAHRVDCFYVYPTVSDEHGPFANLKIGREERSIALLQAARFFVLCGYPHSANYADRARRKRPYAARAELAVSVPRPARSPVRAPDI